MKKLLIILLTLIAVLFSSCNPDSMTSVLFDKAHAQPSSDFKIYSYIGDYNDTNLILGTDKGIMLYDITNETNPIKVIVPPIARPLMLVDNYVVYYEQENGKDAILKAYRLDENKSYNAELLKNNESIVITSVYAFNNGSSVSYTLQEKAEYTESDKFNRTINFYHVESAAMSVTTTEDKVSISITADANSVKSNPELAPYIVGDGYYALLDEDESRNTVYSLDNTEVASSPEEYLIAFYSEFNGHKVLVDTNGTIYIDGKSIGDYGTFPLDNRRVAYSTVIDSKLFVCYKYGPEVLTFADSESEIKIDQLDTSDINNETVVGIKKYNNTYYVITEESEIIRTSLGL